MNTINRKIKRFLAFALALLLFVVSVHWNEIAVWAEQPQVPATTGTGLSEPKTGGTGTGTDGSKAGETGTGTDGSKAGETGTGTDGSKAGETGTGTDGSKMGGTGELTTGTGNEGGESREPKKQRLRSHGQT